MEEKVLLVEHEANTFCHVCLSKDIESNSSDDTDGDKMLTLLYNLLMNQDVSSFKSYY